VSVEKEVEAMKESTSKLEQEVRMLQTFAQDTLELLKELREERVGAKQSQTAPAYYGAQDTVGTAKITMQGNGASAALYGALAALPEQKVPPSALPTAFDRVMSNSKTPTWDTSSAISCTSKEPWRMSIICTP